MKKIFSLFTAILFAGSMWAADPSVRSTFSTSSTITDNQVTENGVTWTLAGSRPVGSPTISTGNASGDGGLKFGSSGSNHFAKVTLSTDYFKDYNVKSVEVKLKNNGKKVGKLTAKQGEVTIGEKNTANTSDWTTLTVNTTKGEGGTLELTYEVAQASYISYIEVVYEEDASVPSITATPATIDFGKVEQNALVEDKEVEVTFANLTGAITYSGLSSPFEASGEIATSGDKITISANTETIGEYNQTLTIKSVADDKEETVIVKMNVIAPAHKYDNTIDCSTIEDFSEWGASYLEHIVAATDAKLVFASACHQTGTITDIPVTKGGDVDLIVTSAGKTLTAVQFICRQWTTKTQTITLQYSTDGGENYADLDPAVTSTEFQVEKVGLPANTNAVKISFSSSSNQVGIASVSYDLKDNGSATAIDNTEATVKAVKFIENGQLFIEKNGHVYNVQGQIVK